MTLFIQFKILIQRSLLFKIISIELKTLLIQIDKSLTNTKVIPIGVGGADGAEAFKSKLKFQIQHEVFR